MIKGEQTLSQLNITIKKEVFLVVFKVNNADIMLVDGKTDSL